MKTRFLYVISLVLLSSMLVGVPGLPAAQAQTAARGPLTATEQIHSERLLKLSEELRCMVCQNQTLADSNAALAVDLRNQVEALMQQGKTDQEIKDYLVQRYGDFVLYRPPVKGSTLLLWFGPFGLLLGGALIWMLVQRRSRQRHADIALPDANARERARQLLD